jgi:hypothetical protein
MYIQALEYNFSQRLQPTYDEYHEENSLVTTRKKNGICTQNKKERYNFILETNALLLNLKSYHIVGSL